MKAFPNRLEVIFEVTPKASGCNADDFMLDLMVLLFEQGLRIHSWCVVGMGAHHTTLITWFNAVALGSVYARKDPNMWAGMEFTIPNSPINLWLLKFSPLISRLLRFTLISFVINNLFSNFNLTIIHSIRIFGFLFIYLFIFIEKKISLGFVRFVICRSRGSCV